MQIRNSVFLVTGGASGLGAATAQMAAAKCAHIRASGASAVVLGDLGCMLNIEGRLRKEGDNSTKVLHIAEVLTGKG